MLLQPYDLYKEGWADAYLMGMVNQVRLTTLHKQHDGCETEINQRANWFIFLNMLFVA